MDGPRSIRVVGARQHNLKGVTVEIPRGALTVITGLSGSGKSSLAFDTIFAEGQRKYVESLSAYARQFLEQMPKPDVERIEGLCPTIAIEQRPPTASPRSTVATTTETYDYLRVLYARLGEPTCWRCGRPIGRQSVAQIVDEVLARPEGQRVLILAPLVRDERGAHRELLERIRREGFVRARVDGEVQLLDDLPPLRAQAKHSIDVVVDRLAVKAGLQQRLADSVETATRLAKGRVIIATPTKAGDYHDHACSTVLACPDHPDVRLAELSPQLLSFNSPHGACPACHGLGITTEFDEELIVPDPERSLERGALAPWRQPGRRSGQHYAELLEAYGRLFDVRLDIPFRNIPADRVHALLHGSDDPAFEGVIPELRRRFETTDSESVKQRLHSFLSETPCPQCAGQRLNPAALAVKIAGRSIGELAQLTIADARAFFDELRFTGEAARVAEPLLAGVRARLGFLEEVGVGYLTLDRRSATLSGGEGQRIRLGTQIGSGLAGVCYVLDEPTCGLHPRDSERLAAILTRLARLDNTVVVVEHDEQVIEAAEHVIDVGPGAGDAGGEIVFAGSLAELRECRASLTADYLTGRQRIALPEQRRPVDPRRLLEVKGATAHNLKNLDVAFPLGCFTCVTGVSGSGKSTLVGDILLRVLKRNLGLASPKPGAFYRVVGTEHVDAVVEVDQSPIGRTPRSIPATYVGAFDLIRRLYARTREARIRGYQPNRFSFNVKGGRCEECQGQGTRRIEMHFLPDMYVSCAACAGARYNRETLEVRYRGHTIADVLALRVAEAVKFFDSFPKLRQRLQVLKDVGLGYVALGQASNTLSGGEAQRIKLAAELQKAPSEHTVYVLDEPTTGLHFADVRRLLTVLDRLVDRGHTVIVIEHNLDVIKTADWVIDLGPEGGDAGGQIVAQGAPEQIADCPASHTGRFLRNRAIG